MTIIKRGSSFFSLLSCILFLVACGPTHKPTSNAATPSLAQAQNEVADIVYTNAKIYTVNNKEPWAEAIAIKGSEILAVGSDESITAHIGDATKVSDLQGKMILPGFVDSHAHPIHGGAFVLTLALDTYARPADWIQAIEEYANTHKELPIIFGYGFLASSFGENGPDKAMIDKVVGDRPVLLMDEGFHGGWANTKALELLGIDKDTNDIAPGFSYYKRDENGNPTGYLLEETATKAMGDLNVITTESIIEGSAVLIEIMNSYGITAVFDAGSFGDVERQISVLKQLKDTGKMTIRYVGAVMAASQEGYTEAVESVTALREQTKNDQSPISMLKILTDGTVEGKTAAMFEDYQNDPGNKGETVFTQAQLDQMIGGAAGNNVDVHIHALGERAIHEALNAIESARNNHPESGSRFAICHIQVIADKDLPRFAELDVIAQSTPLWSSYDQEGKKFVSKDQFNRYYRVNSLKEQGVKLTFGSDFPASGAGTLGMSPIFNIEIGHTRQNVGESSAPIQPPESERLDIASLIKGYTLDGAYQLRMEDKIGSLEVGKKADLVVLDKNLFETNPYTFSDIKIISTMVDGVVVYQNEQP